MTRQAAVVEANLRRLDAATVGALVADLWAARGYETVREGGVVVATRDGESVTLYPVDPDRLGSTPEPGRPVDVVVAPGGGRAAADLAGRLDATLLDATDLRELLSYAVDRPVGTALCERHLGAAPPDLRPPLRDRLRGRLSGLDPPASAASVLTVLLAIACVVLVAGAGFGALAGTPSDAFAGTAPGTDAGSGDAAGASDGAAGDVRSATDSGAPTPVSAVHRTSPPESASESVPVPGVGSDGVENLTALAAAHRRAVGARSHTLWIDVYRPRGGNPDAARVQRDVDVAVAGGRYLLTATVETSDGRRSIVREVYHDGVDRYTADVDGDEVRYRRTSLETTGSAGRSNATAVAPLELRRTLVTRYLSTPETTVEGTITEEGRTLYRVAGNGRPPSFDSVDNYTVLALVDDRGLVRDLTVEYDVVTRNGTYDRRFEVTYDRLDRTTVDPPAWYRRQFVGEGSPTPDESAGDGTRTTDSTFGPMPRP